MTSANEMLLPCPICGGQPDFQHFNITPNVQGRIVCSCGIELRQGKSDTEDDMCIIWNTRSDYAVQAENERKVEQAIAATLGSGTCRLHYGEDDDGYDGWYCDECGGWFQAVRRDGHLVKPKHCQNCGRKAKR